MTGQKAPARRCSWHHCSATAAATVAFQLPNLLAGSRRDYCQQHTRQVRLARGTVVVARFGRRQPSPASSADANGGRRARQVRPNQRKGVVP
jgi:hypothetical protein